MSNLKNREIILLVILFALWACKDNKSITRDVLLGKTSYNREDSILLVNSKIDYNNKIVLYGSIAVDSIVMKYTKIDSISQFVDRIFYSKIFEKPHIIRYKLIIKRTKAFIEYPDEKIRSLYLDTETRDAVVRNFKDLTQDTIPPPPTFYLSGELQYISYIKDSISNITYYVFRGNDIAFSRNMDGYFYFDSIFHLKKVYNKDVLLYCVNSPANNAAQISPPAHRSVQ